LVKEFVEESDSSFQEFIFLEFDRMPKKIIPLTDNFLFKVIFSENEDSLLDLLNSFPDFQGENKIENLKVLNPELPKISETDKLSVLDIRAESKKGETFLIEMQAFREESFPKRILFYWSKVYAKTLRKGNHYNLLKKVYSINFTEFNFLDTPKFHSVFQLREKEYPEILLTEDLEIHIIELPKFIESLKKINTEFESWIFALKNGHELKGEEMNTLVKKNPKLKKVLKEQKEYSLNPKSRYYKELKQKSEMVMNGRISYARNEGIEIGEQKGELRKAFIISDELKERGFPFKEICEITGLTEKQILEYRKKNRKK
jgi:predicted transposase/invertase (TIGR01784 family)